MNAYQRFWRRINDALPSNDSLGFPNLQETTQCHHSEGFRPPEPWRGWKAEFRQWVKDMKLEHMFPEKP